MDDYRTPAQRLALDLGRTADRLRSMGLARLAASFEPEPTRAEAARTVAQTLADAAADLDGEPRRTVPRLRDDALGDQLAVCGRELIEVAERRGGDDAARAALDQASALVLDLRRRL